ncbi:hypothetical protein [Aromatoleum aromaticum]|uniref:hypothetical protein n=1 Tax=Aromatoleum aromaticum TaxID=551760 RepID=UPI0014599FBE|nr:hypothetical protein [Aromatoleum aromaticum]NMG56602.1 hypothetical protein [Aromatoleum aromaticum]
MGLVKRFWGWLTTSAGGRVTKGHPDLYPIEVDKLAQELRLNEEAKRLGEAGLPTPDAKVITGPEAATVQRVEKARQDYVDWAVMRLNVLSEDLGRRDIIQDANRARQADKEFERKASARLSENVGVLKTLRETAHRRRTELDAFKAKHCLEREAHYPTPTGSFLRYGVLAMLVLLEGAFNAVFFAKGIDTGLLGGFGMAAAFAALNVVVAFIIGKIFVRYVNHAKLVLKVLGWTSVVVALTAMGTIGLGIAHYRDALTAELANPAQATLQTLSQTPFELTDMFSWALFILSFVFGLIALYDGLSSDDLYPGYGTISRRARVAFDDYEDELTELRSELEEMKNEKLEALDDAVKKSQAGVARIGALIEDKRTAGSRLQTALRDADHSLEALLRKFRTENQLHRSGLVRPKYFDTLPELRPIEIPDFSTFDDVSALAAQEEHLKALLAEVQDIRGRIQAAFNEQFDRLTPLDSQFVRKEAT